MIETQQPADVGRTGWTAVVITVAAAIGLGAAFVGLVLSTGLDETAAAAWFAVRFPQVQPVVSAAVSSYEHGRAAGNRLIAEEVHELLDFILERLLAMQAAGVSQTRARRAPDDLGLSRPFSDDLGLSPPR